VLHRELVGDAQHLGIVLAEDDLAVILQERLALAAVERVASCRSISAGNVSARARLVVTRIAGEFTPCSAWPSRSVAAISASQVSSAISIVSVGPR
jgi:hypothetical protein